MQISIQSVEITYNKVHYRFIVKRVVNTSRNEVSFQCWAPYDNISARELIKDKVLTFEWDQQKEDFRNNSDSPLSDQLKKAIREHFPMESV